jgi:hypothetical protein
MPRSFKPLLFLYGNPVGYESIFNELLRAAQERDWAVHTDSPTFSGVLQSLGVPHQLDQGRFAYALLEQLMTTADVVPDDGTVDDAPGAAEEIPGARTTMREMRFAIYPGDQDLRDYVTEHLLPMLAIRRLPWRIAILTGWKEPFACPETCIPGQVQLNATDLFPLFGEPIPIEATLAPA